MDEKEFLKEYSLDDEGFYISNEIFKGRVWLEKCTQCGDYLYFIYAEKYLYFKGAGVMMILDIKIYGQECDTCNCGFIYNDG